MRLIDADAWERFFYEHMSDEEMIRAKIALDEMPTIDERPHGGWKYFEDDDYTSGGYNMCSVCNWKFSFGAYPLIYEDNYCPHCGAKIGSGE